LLVIDFLLGEDKIETINKHKEKRIDAQYYMKVDQEGKIEEMLKEAQECIAMFDEIVSNLAEDEINENRDKISGAITKKDDKKIKKGSDKSKK
jgi:hypothetical protein